MPFIGRYMVEFGALSSLFDIFTFVVLLVVFNATPPAFQTAWFIESC
jgi:Mg2+-importing ATPase